MCVEKRRQEMSTKKKQEISNRVKTVMGRPARSLQQSASGSRERKLRPPNMRDYSSNQNFRQQTMVLIGDKCRKTHPRNKHNTSSNSNKNPLAPKGEELQGPMDELISSKLSSCGVTYSCSACEQIIQDKHILGACNKFWHENCLKCDRCQARLVDLGSSLYEKFDMKLCRQDYFELYGHKAICSVCEKLIYASEMVMRAKMNVYHLECFACQLCGLRFCVGDRFYLCENKIVCQYDYDEHIVPIQKSFYHLPLEEAGPFQQQPQSQWLGLDCSNQPGFEQLEQYADAAALAARQIETNEEQTPATLFTAMDSSEIRIEVMLGCEQMNEPQRLAASKDSAGLAQMDGCEKDNLTDSKGDNEEQQQQLTRKTETPPPVPGAKNGQNEGD